MHGNLSLNKFPSASIPNCRQVITHNRVRSNPTEINGLSNQWLIDYPSQRNHIGVISSRNCKWHKSKESNKVQKSKMARKVNVRTKNKMNIGIKRYCNPPDQVHSHLFLNQCIH